MGSSLSGEKWKTWQLLHPWRIVAPSSWLRPPWWQGQLQTCTIFIQPRWYHLVAGGITWWGRHSGQCGPSPVPVHRDNLDCSRPLSFQPLWQGADSNRWPEEILKGYLMVLKLLCSSRQSWPLEERKERELRGWRSRTLQNNRFIKTPTFSSSQPSSPIPQFYSTLEPIPRCLRPACSSTEQTHKCKPWS